MQVSQLFIWFCASLVVCRSQEYLESQPSVTTNTKERALYLWVHVDPSANVTEVAKVAARLQDHVHSVSPPDEVTETTEVLAGVGFGEQFYQKVSKNPRNFTHVSRTGLHGILPATGGDLFVHAKSDSTSKLFELAQEFLRKLPKDSVEFFEDYYGFVYKNGRDLSGFIDGTENPKAEWHRKEAAVEKETGGSFTLTQRWIHDMKLIEETQVTRLERIVGRTLNDSVRLNPLPVSSHVSRMVGASFPHKKFEVVRQSMPYGDLHSECGLFFISYANTTEKHNFMLDNMVGAGESPHNDDIMLLSKAVSGNLWYFPGVEELKELA